MQGTVLRNRYRIIKPLACAGFGDTYLAQDLDFPHNPPCVVKRLQLRSSNPLVIQTAQRLFRQEGKVLSRLGKHNQIPQLLAYFEENKQFYLVQEFIQGHDLSEELRFNQRWSEKQVIDFLVDALSILKFVHQQQIIHRDIKPANIIRRAGDGKLVLIDFGAVKEIKTLAIQPTEKTGLTVAIGTPGYMPNEQRAGKPRLNSDIYALGMIAIRALTGILPDHLNEDSETGEIIWRDQAQVNSRLATIIDKMVRSHFRERYQSVSEVLEDLQIYQSPDVLTQVIAKINDSPVLVKSQGKIWLKALPVVAVSSFVGFVVGIPRLFPLFPTTSASRAVISPVPEIVTQAANREAQTLLQEGEEFIAQGKHEKALSAYYQALTLQPEYFEAQRELCQLLNSLGEHEAALIACDRALEINSDHAEALSSRCLVLASLGREGKAVEDCNRAVQINPNSAVVWNDRGSAMKNLQRHSEALTAYQKALQIQPDLYYAWNNLGNLQASWKRNQEALAAYDRAIDLQPELHYAWNGRANVLKTMERDLEALAAYDRVIALKPDLEAAIVSRDQIRQKLGIGN